ncbi:MAG: hypothetical protein K9K86_02025 [Pseudomonadales bacterium]|nr:hypothetical protein [Pseudomonadales bacterium]
MNEDKQEKDKFENIAKELECDTSDEALDKAFGSIEPKTTSQPEEKSDSDKD